MKKICMHYLVTGRVQGVWFRANTQKQADILGLTGWVKNLPDGRVEVMACGEPLALEKLYEWLLIGPQLARVDNLDSEEMIYQEFDAFDVL